MNAPRIAGLALLLLGAADAGAHGGHGPGAVTPSAVELARAAAEPTPLARGKAFYRIGAMERARRELNAALAADPRSVEALRYRAMVHTHERRFQDAFADFDRALAASPAPPELYEVLYYYGDAIFNAGIYDKAAQRFEELLRLKPDHVDARCYLGEALAKMGRTREAEAAFRKALEYDPKSSWAHHSLGDVLVKLGRDAEAASAYRRDLELVPHCQTARIGLARALERLGRTDEAIREYYTSLAYHLGDPESHNGMARLYLARGEAARSYAEYARALEFDPQNREARAGLEEARRRLAEAAGASRAELIFWRYVGSWVPAALVAAAFLWSRYRQRRA